MPYILSSGAFLYQSSYISKGELSPYMMDFFVTYLLVSYYYYLYYYPEIEQMQNVRAYEKLHSFCSISCSSPFLVNSAKGALSLSRIFVFHSLVGRSFSSILTN